MTNQEIYSKRFSERAIESGFSESYIDKCLGYAIPLIERGFPVIYNINHLSVLVGYNVSYIKRAIKFSDFFYRKFTIEKRNGRKRILFEPLPSLKEIQLWILEEILYKKKPSRYAKGYVPKRSIREHTIYHTDSINVLTLDITDFFKSINFELVEVIFHEMGYSKLVANMLTKLCFKEKELPQGAPTSPYISNLILNNFDQKISEYCIPKNIKYTRYADDLAFSGELNDSEIEVLVNTELKKLGLSLNKDKKKLMRPNDPQLISGIIVNKKAQVPKRVRNTLRNEMYHIMTFGLASHMEKTNQKKPNYLNHLLGKINYVLQINPRDKEFIEYREHIHSLKKNNQSIS